MSGYDVDTEDVIISRNVLTRNNWEDITQSIVQDTYSLMTAAAQMGRIDVLTLISEILDENVWIDLTIGVHPISVGIHYNQPDVVLMFLDYPVNFNVLRNCLLTCVLNMPEIAPQFLEVYMNDDRNLHAKNTFLIMALSQALGLKSENVYLFDPYLTRIFLDRAEAMYYSINNIYPEITHEVMEYIARRQFREVER